MKAICLICNKIQVGHKLYLLTNRLGHLLNRIVFLQSVGFSDYSVIFLDFCLFALPPRKYFSLSIIFRFWQVTKTRTVLILDRCEQRRKFAYHAHKLGCHWRLITWTKKIIALVAFWSPSYIFLSPWRSLLLACEQALPGLSGARGRWSFFFRFFFFASGELSRRLACCFSQCVLDSLSLPPRKSR